MKEIKGAIYVILRQEHRVNAKLDMLTSIYLSTTCKKVRKATEDIRDELCAGTNKKQKDEEGDQLDFTYQRKGSRKVLLKKASDADIGGDGQDSSSQEAITG